MMDDSNAPLTELHSDEQTNNNINFVPNEQDIENQIAQSNEDLAISSELTQSHATNRTELTCVLSELPTLLVDETPDPLDIEPNVALPFLRSY